MIADSICIIVGFVHVFVGTLRGEKGYIWKTINYYIIGIFFLALAIKRF